MKKSTKELLVVLAGMGGAVFLLMVLSAATTR